MRLHPLVEAKQDKNLECLSCHTVGLGDPKGFSRVDHLAQMKVESKQDEPFFASNEEFALYLGDVREGKSLDTKVKLFKKTIPIRDSLSLLNRPGLQFSAKTATLRGLTTPLIIPSK